MATLLKEDHYGYEVCAKVKEKTNGNFEVKEGVIYPLLSKLLEDGYVSSYEKTFNRKIRVYYKIEEKGRKYLQELIEDFKTRYAILETYLEDCGVKL